MIGAPFDQNTGIAMTSLSAPAAHTDDRRRRVSIGFINWAHGLDHYVMLILATVRGQ
jgi:hypothetical protein